MENTIKAVYAIPTPLRNKIKQEDGRSRIFLLPDKHPKVTRFSSESAKNFVPLESSAWRLGTATARHP
ncbi:MAG: hypothetical protein WCJ26_13020 [bacterium]